MAYVVGLLATDGCLSSSGRHIFFDSCDESLVRTFLSCLGRPIRYRTTSTRVGGLSYQAAFGDVRFYRWLVGIGLMPRKSLVLGAIDVPDAHLPALLRGLFEGDGTIQNFTHRPTPSTYPTYAYERLWTYFTSASRAHIEWIRERTSSLLSVRGYIEVRPPREGRHAFYRLKFGKRDSITLLSAMYPTDDVPKLERKWKVWHEYRLRRLPGSSSAGGGI